MGRIYRHFTSQRLVILDRVIEAGLILFVTSVLIMAATWLIVHIYHETQTHKFSEDPAFEGLKECFTAGEMVLTA